MPFDGNGTYTPPPAPVFPAVDGELVRADYFNQVINDLASGITSCLTKSGQSAASAQIPFANGIKTLNIEALTAAAAVLFKSGSVQIGKQFILLQDTSVPGGEVEFLLQVDRLNGGNLTVQGSGTSTDFSLVADKLTLACTEISLNGMLQLQGASPGGSEAVGVNNVIHQPSTTNPPAFRKSATWIEIWSGSTTPVNISTAGCYPYSGLLRITCTYGGVSYTSLATYESAVRHIGSLFMLDGGAYLAQANVSASGNVTVERYNRSTGAYIDNLTILKIERLR